MKLQHALARALSLQADESFTSAELEQIAIEDYTKEFGHSISDRAIRSLIKRTLERDQGNHDFARLEIYLAENAARKQAIVPNISLSVESDFRALHDAIAAFADPARPSDTEKSYLWLRAFELYEEKVEEGKNPKKAKRALLLFLERNAPFLASAEVASVAESLRVSFYRKYDRWKGSQENASALIDGRKEHSGRWRTPELSQKDKDALIAHAVLNCGGRLAQAWRELIEAGKLSESITSYYLSNPSRKSYVPKKILEAVKYEVAMMEDIHHGPRQDKLNGAHISRDWSKVYSMDWWQADDFTMPVYFRVPDIKAKGGWSLMRGQVLVMIDLRTTRILGFVLLSQKNYHARAIRTLITKVADKYGLPRKGFYFERGIWELSKLLKGDSNTDPFSGAEMEMGLRGLGLQFRHANLPRGKPIEGVGGAFQNLMEGIPGYVGRNEMTEKFERVQLLKREAEKGEPKALAYFLDEEQWADTLEKVFAQYNATRQEGKMTGGLSPDQAFEKFNNLSDPPAKFSPACRYLLAHHKRPVRVTSNGITLRFGNETFNYRNEATGRLRGQTVFAWFNPETPEYLTVTDLNNESPFSIVRSQEVPAMDATPEQLGQELARIEDHQGYAKARYRVLIVFDEAHYLWPQSNYREALPSRVNWIMTALVNHGVPVSLVTTPQFIRSQKALERKTCWTSEQFTGRIAHYTKLPDSLAKEDLEAVSRSLLPEGCGKSIETLVVYAQGSAKYLAAIQMVVNRARFIAARSKRQAVIFSDIKEAIQGSVIPSDSALAEALADQPKPGRKGVSRALSAIPQDSFRGHETTLPDQGMNRLADRNEDLTVETPRTARSEGNLTAV